MPGRDGAYAYAACQVYPEAVQVVVLRLQRGGRIYDLASLLSGGSWGRELRGEAFRTAREIVVAAVG